MTKLDIEKDAEWILPENLEKAQKKIRDLDVEGLDVTTDFGSYRALNNDRCDSGIEMHNATGTAAINYARALSYISQQYGLTPNTIADIGCGGGFIASIVRGFFVNSSLHAYDISEDAVEYGKKKFPTVTFFSKAIKAGMTFDYKYDLIYANEFYPFTRTESNNVYFNYINTLFNAVTDNGILVVSMIKSTKCLVNDMDQIKKQFHDSMDIREKIIPLPKIYRYFPIFKLAQVLTILVNRMLGRRDYVAVVFSHKRHCT